MTNVSAGGVYPVDIDADSRDFGEHDHLARAHHRDSANVGTLERLASGAVGAGLILSGLRRGGPIGIISACAGGLLAYHGARRHSPTYGFLGIDDEDATFASHPFSRSVHSRARVTVNRKPDELYDEWRNISGLTRYFPHVESIEELGGGRSRWTGVAPGGQEIEWEAEITEDRDGRRLSWETVGETPFEHQGHVEFADAPAGRGTRVVLDQRYHLPAGAIGALVARLAGRDPQIEAEKALHRFKQWMEAGEITTPVGPAARDDGWVTGESPREARSRQVGHGQPKRDQVHEASVESFPASDPPSFTANASTTDEPRHRAGEERS